MTTSHYCFAAAWPVAGQKASFASLTVSPLVASIRWPLGCLFTQWALIELPSRRYSCASLYRCPRVRIPFAWENNSALTLCPAKDLNPCVRDIFDVLLTISALSKLQMHMEAAARVIMIPGTWTHICRAQRRIFTPWLFPVTPECFFPWHVLCMDSSALPWYYKGVAAWACTVDCFSLCQGCMDNISLHD